MMKKYILLSLLVFAFSSCVKDTLYNTDHPEQEKLVVKAKFNISVSDKDLPDNFLFQLNDKISEVSFGDGFYEMLVDPGHYDLKGYNVPEGFKQDEKNVLSIEQLADGSILAHPDYLFSFDTSLDAQQDRDMNIELPIYQRIRKFQLILRIVEGDLSRIRSIKGKLSGIESAYNLENFERLGRPAVVNLEFHNSPIITRAEESLTSEFYATGRFLGVVPTHEQLLTLTITFTDGTTQIVEEDLSKSLSSFNSDIIPFELSANLKVPVEANVSAVISDWKVEEKTIVVK